MTKKELVRSATFIVLILSVLFGIQSVLDYGVRNSDYAHFNKINILAAHKLDPGIAIFGSSVSEVGLDPAIFKQSTGLETYNFSIDGTGFEQINGLLKEFSEYSKDCKVVVLTEFFASFQKLNQLTEVQRFAGHISNENIYRSLHAIQPDLAWKIRNVPFYEFIVVEHPYYKASVLGWKKKLLKQNQNLDPTMGFFPKDLIWDPALDAVNKKTNPIIINIDQEIVEEYGKTLQLLKKGGRKVVILMPPVQKDGKALIKNAEDFKTVCKKFAGGDIYFLDCYDLPLSENKSFFYNNAHVNRAGSVIFSTYVADFVQGILAEKK